MGKGAVAKENVEKKIAAAFGENYIGTFDKKIYVMANDGGEMCQIAISLTCPKTPIATSGFATSGDYDFSDTSTPAVTTVASTVVEPKNQVEITQEEQQNLADLLAKFGL